VPPLAALKIAALRGVVGLWSLALMVNSLTSDAVFVPLVCA